LQELKRDTGIDALIEQLCKEDEEYEASCRRESKKSARSTRQRYSNAISTSPDSCDSDKSARFHLNIQPPTLERVLARHPCSAKDAISRTTTRTLSNWSANTSGFKPAPVPHSSLRYNDLLSSRYSASLSSYSSSISRSSWSPYLAEAKYFDEDNRPTTSNKFFRGPVTLYAAGLDVPNGVDAYRQTQPVGSRQSPRADDEDLVPAGFLFPTCHS